MAEKIRGSLIHAYNLKWREFSRRCERALPTHPGREIRRIADDPACPSVIKSLALQQAIALRDFATGRLLSDKEPAVVSSSLLATNYWFRVWFWLRSSGILPSSS
jgi:hypothetical protein